MHTAEARSYCPPPPCGVARAWAACRTGAQGQHITDPAGSCPRPSLKQTAVGVGARGGERKRQGQRAEGVGRWRWLLPHPHNSPVLCTVRHCACMRSAVAGGGPSRAQRCPRCPVPRVRPKKRPATKTNQTLCLVNGGIEMSSRPLIRSLAAQLSGLWRSCSAHLAAPAICAISYLSAIYKESAGQPGPAHGSTLLAL